VTGCLASLTGEWIVLRIVWIFNKFISIGLLALDFPPDLQLSMAHSTLRIIIVFVFIYLIVISSALKRVFSRCWSDSVRWQQEFGHFSTFNSCILNTLQSKSTSNLGCTYFLSGISKCISMLENFINELLLTLILVVAWNIQTRITCKLNSWGISQIGCIVRSHSHRIILPWSLWEWRCLIIAIITWCMWIITRCNWKAWWHAHSRLWMSGLNLIQSNLIRCCLWIYLCHDGVIIIGLTRLMQLICYKSKQDYHQHCCKY